MIAFWTLLIITMSSWNVHNIQQHVSENARNSVENTSLQTDVLKAWTTSHIEQVSQKEPPPLSQLQVDNDRTITPIASSSFFLERQQTEGISRSTWNIIRSRENTTTGRGQPVLSNNHLDNETRYTITRPLPDSARCTGCHHGYMSYAVTQTADDRHLHMELFSLVGGYFLLFIIGIALSSVSHKKIIRSARAKHIYESKLQEQYESQKALSSILKLAISNAAISEKLQGVLDIVSAVSWLQLQSGGIIFTANNGQLLMAAAKGIPPAIKEQCHQVPIGDCLCGAAANSRRLEYTPHIDVAGEQVHCQPEAHGHYCVPITHEETLLGLLALHVEDQHQGGNDEIKFLSAVGDSLGTMLHRSNIEQRLRFDAYHDQLTGIANRTQLAERVNHCMTRAHGTADDDYCLLFLDLDRFKHINDSLGHHIGDGILIETARRLSLLLRDCDTIARLGGDEFAILLDGIESISAAQTIAGRIHQTLDKTIHIEAYDLHTTCSIGIAYCHHSYRSFDHMLRDADIAMYVAKTSSSDKTVTFNQQMYQVVQHNLSIESELRLAQQQGELVTYFQPIYSARRNRYIGAEALIRWNRNGTLTPPGEFIGVAEDSGIIIALGQHVLHQACQMIKQLVMTGCDDDFYISVNVSAKQMLNRNMIEVIDTALEQYGIPTYHLRLEITESLFADNSPLITEHLTRIRARGIKLLIDDFGTGYSSLSFLHNHPFDCVKIDRSFVSGISVAESRQRSEKLITTIANLADNLGMSIVAEGVEDERQLQYLKGIGCDLIQGYLFSRPLAPADFLRTFSQQPYAASSLVAPASGHSLNG